MKNKIISFFIILLSLNTCYADAIPNNLKEVVKGLSIQNGIEILKFNNKKYLVAIANADINGKTPHDKLKAIKIAKHLSQLNVSKFINGEDIDIREKLTSIRVVESIGSNHAIVQDDEVYEEFIKTASSGAIRNMRNMKWRENGIYYVATLMRINN